MQIVPLTAVPSQTLTVVLNQQNCTINVYQKTTGLYLDLFLGASTTPTVSCIICRDRVLLVRQEYLGFVGDLSFVDTQGTDDPYYTGLGTRYVLFYILPTDPQ